MITALTQPMPKDLGKEIARTQALTEKSFAMNLTLLPKMGGPPYEDIAARSSRAA